MKADQSRIAARIAGDKRYLSACYRGHTQRYTSTANAIKRNASLAEVRAIAEWLDRMQSLAEAAARCNLV